MSKGKHGNKEAKKPKKVKMPGGALAPAGATPAVAPATQDRPKKR